MRWLILYPCAFTYKRCIQDRALSKYGYQSRKNVTLESPEQMQLEEESMLHQVSSNNRVAASTIGFSAPTVPTPSFAASFSNVSKESTPQKQTTTVTRDGKKRIHPIFIAGNATAGSSSLPPTSAPQVTVWPFLTLLYVLLTPVSRPAFRRKVWPTDLHFQSRHR